MAFAPTDVDFTKLEDPPVLDDAAKKDLNVETKQVNVTLNGKVLQIHVEEASRKSGGTKFGVLFLHGMKFSSKNWLEIASVYHVAHWGYRAVAVDLPGYGKSPKEALALEHCNAFMKELLSVLGLSRPVIVSPSMSGRFSLSYLFSDGSDSTERARGYVPVAPIMTTEHVGAYKASQLPTLVVCGTNDTMIGQVSTTDLMQLPKAKYAPIQDGGHPCYLDNPDAFHKLLCNFLVQL